MTWTARASLLGGFLLPRSANQTMAASKSAQLIGAVIKQIARTGVTHAELATRAGLPRSAVTGILSGSLQKVTIARILRLVEAADLAIDVRVRKAARAN